MNPTIWPARLHRGRVSADTTDTKILCGRKGPDGQYVCTGEIAYYVRAWSLAAGYAAQGTFVIPPGLIEDPGDPGMYVWSKHAQERLQRGDKPQFKQGWQRNVTGHLVQGWKWVEPPFRRECPHCGCTALIESAVLS